ncbi:MAG: serine acetyltransferase [candidate division Zixibacteria bacterium]|nr:serine acetyltransferase [candidate division Zixibacteria bacterium]
MTHPDRTSLVYPSSAPQKQPSLGDTRQYLASLSSRIVESYAQLGGFNNPEGVNLPSREHVVSILNNLLTLCFPGYFGAEPVLGKNAIFFVDALVDAIYIHLREEIARSLIYATQDRRETVETCHDEADRVTIELIEELPRIRTLLMKDVDAAYAGDPAAKSHDEIILSYPCVEAIATHRIAHELYVRKIPLIPRIMSEHAHSRTGIDIHPGAMIGSHFFIDHGTGVVIGETAEIGQNVKLYQGVTLGALSFRKDKNGRLVKGGKRHPTIEDDVIIYSGATILGGATVIGQGSVIGANVWLTESVPPHTKVTVGKPNQEMVQRSARTA